MNCKTAQTWMMDGDDVSLTANRRAELTAHFDKCASCARMAQEMASVRQLLRGLEPVQTSSQFDAALAERLAQSHRSAEPRSWWQAWTVSTTSLLRPALALGAALFALVSVLFLHMPSAPVPVTTPPVDAVLISQCVALHQRDVAAQPLSDLAGSGMTAGHSAWTGDATASAAAQDNL